MHGLAFGRAPEFKKTQARPGSPAPGFFWLARQLTAPGPLRRCVRAGPGRASPNPERQGCQAVEGVRSGASAEGPVDALEDFFLADFVDSPPAAPVRPAGPESSVAASGIREARISLEPLKRPPGSITR
jgi:hypothetical protein